MTTSSLNTVPANTDFYSQRVMLVSDSIEVGQALEQFVFSGLAMSVVARMQTFDNIVDAAHRFSPDVMVAYFTDIDAQRVERIRLVVQALPSLNVLVIANTVAMSIVREVFSAGAKGYLLDMPSREELLDALTRIADQRQVLDAELRKTAEGRRFAVW
jgi:DNA-binding NarL/FixJ family response regulator